MEWLKQHIVGVISILVIIVGTFVGTIQKQTKLENEVQEIKVEQDRRQENIALQVVIEKRLTILENNSESINEVLKNQANALNNFKEQNTELKVQTALIENSVTSLNKTLDKVNNTLDKLNETVATTNKDLAEVKVKIEQVKER